MNKIQYDNETFVFTKSDNRKGNQIGNFKNMKYFLKKIV